MLINSGYWNYYLAFRIKDYAKHIEEIKRKNNFSGMLAYITDDTVLTNINTDDLLRERKANIIKAQNELSGNESYEALYELYQADKLPEYFFDYDNSLNDLLEKKIADSISRVRFANHGYQQILHSFGKGKCEYYVLMPLKVYFTDSDYEYCLVYIQLLTSGNGIIKLEIPLKNISTETFCYYPMRRWFSYIKVWAPLFTNGAKEGYKIVLCDSCGIQDITTTLINYVHNIFPESIVDKDRFTGFETFVLSDFWGYEKHDIKNNEQALSELYHFVFPEDHLCTPDIGDLKQFWEEAHFNINGIDFVKGYRARLIVYADVPEMMRQKGRNDIEDKNSYLQATITGTFDPFIVLALAQKDNEISIFRMSEQTKHAISRNMIQYYANANYLDSMLLAAPKNGIDFYNEVQKMFNNFSGDFIKMLERMQRIEDYEKIRLKEKQTTLLNRLTLIFTVLFGLPLIQDTLSMVREVFGISRDLIPIITMKHISFVVWLGLIFYMLTDHIDYQLEYAGFKMDQKSSVTGRIKKLFLVIYGWIILKFKPPK